MCVCVCVCVCVGSCVDVRTLYVKTKQDSNQDITEMQFTFFFNALYLVRISVYSLFLSIIYSALT